MKVDESIMMKVAIMFANALQYNPIPRDMEDQMLSYSDILMTVAQKEPQLLDKLKPFNMNDYNTSLFTRYVNGCLKAKLIT